MNWLTSAFQELFCAHTLAEIGALLLTGALIGVLAIAVGA